MIRFIVSEKNNLINATLTSYWHICASSAKDQQSSSSSSKQQIHAPYYWWWRWWFANRKEHAHLCPEAVRGAIARNKLPCNCGQFDDRSHHTFVTSDRMNYERIFVRLIVTSAYECHSLIRFTTTNSGIADQAAVVACAHFRICICLCWTIWLAEW